MVGVEGRKGCYAYIFKEDARARVGVGEESLSFFLPLEGVEQLFAVRIKCCTYIRRTNKHFIYL